ncbi:Phosphorylase superfamily [cyanobacterium endosymbiont of Rhopalodia gibberula]|uniref:5'-methylthioadenosine/S-adenosylhomocysteine nucleosidase family protein n=1 Tax=cyanobacterium endosymbiont of Rhopalodia gibberula TaxID=1763363 RepID=UPI000DC6E5A5|nr:hypothetical protein [cyanobacterium endosymbiont of Rhopalodia gibberula]BBA78723.1 Phosphorylase superfamily [cyanobacterium endosymbiont of Rhopalodia gibberula]
MSSSLRNIPITNYIDTILVPRGAEYKVVCEGFREVKQFCSKIKIIQIPVGLLPFKHYLKQWQQIHEFINHPPKGILLMGLCGSLSPNYQVGDKIIYQKCCLISNNILPPPWQTCDVNLNKLIYHYFNKRIIQGKAVTSDHIITSAEEKWQLGRSYQADVVDMEGIPLLEFCNYLKIPVAMIRVISDNCEQDLPNLTPALEENGSLNPWRLTFQMSKNPLSSIHLIRSSLKGLKTLKKVSKDLATAITASVVGHPF